MILQFGPIEKEPAQMILQFGPIEKEPAQMILQFGPIEKEPAQMILQFGPIEKEPAQMILQFGPIEKELPLQRQWHKRSHLLALPLCTSRCSYVFIYFPVNTIVNGF
jgi:hypothetical protein